MFVSFAVMLGMFVSFAVMPVRQDDVCDQIIQKEEVKTESSAHG